VLFIGSEFNVCNKYAALIAIPRRLTVEEPRPRGPKVEGKGRKGAGVLKGCIPCQEFWGNALEHKKALGMHVVDTNFNIYN